MILFNKYITFFTLKMFLRRKLNRLFIKHLYGSFGRKSIFQKPLMIYNRKSIFIGNNVTIRPGLRVEPIVKYGEDFFTPKISIGDGTTIEQNCHIICANEIKIGNNVTIAGYTLITDNDHDYSDLTKGVLEQKLIVKSTVIKDNVFIGMGSRIMPGVTIGKNSVVGANSVITKDVPDNSVVAGIPAKVLKKYDNVNKMWVRVK